MEQEEIKEKKDEEGEEEMKEEEDEREKKIPSRLVERATLIYSVCRDA